MSVVSIPLAPGAASGPLPEAIEQIEQDKVRVVLTRDGEPVAAIVPVKDLLALEALDGAEDAYWEQAADEAHARWEAEGRPRGISHEDLLARHGITPDTE